MIIPKKQMQNIVEEVGSTIHKNVNIMDENGRIIASTDTNRIGMYHSGAIELLNNNLNELIVEEETETSKNGINLPLVIENQVIGVVGITGAIEEVGMLGNVIKKMTEILIWDWYKRNQKNEIDGFKRNIAVELLFGKEEEQAQDRWSLLGLKMELLRMVTVVDVVIDGHGARSEQEIFASIFADIKKKVEKDTQQFLISMGMRIIIFYKAASETALGKIIKETQKQIEEAYPCKTFWGVGSPAAGKSEMQKSYKEADFACNFVKQLSSESVKFYKETDISMLMTEIPAKKRRAYVKDVFKECSQEQKEEIINCMRCYIRNNGSISKVADELFIHKNTLQYRIMKTKTLTNYDPRILEEFIPIVIAMYLDDLN